MDGALPWIVLALAGAFVLISIPIALIAWILRASKNATLGARIERLEREVAALREERTRVASEPGNRATSAPERPAPFAPPATAVEFPAPPAPPPPIVELPKAPSPRPAPSIPAARAPAVEAPRPQPAPKPPFQWEQWIGVKGAALAAGALLALGGLLFVQHAIRHGWIDAQARCVIAALCGAAAIGASWPLRKRGYLITSDALTGAGVSMLFGATWAARVLYELVPFWFALLAMIAITVVCGSLAARRNSQTIAIFGVLGGFATPLLLSLGASQPIGLFAYLLVLQGVVLALGRNRRWPALASLASLASPIVFLVWVATRYDEAHLPFALAFCGFSALGFAFGSSGGEGLRARLAPIVGSLSPFFFAAYFAGSAHLSRHLVPVAILLAVLEASAAWTAARTRLPGLMFAAGVGCVATVLTWLLTTVFDGALAWEAAGIVVGLAAVPHLALELVARRKDASLAFADAVGACTLGFAVLAVAASVLVHQPAPWSSLAAAVALSALCVRQTALGARGVLLFVASLAPILAFFAWSYVDFRGPHPLDPAREAWLVVALGALPFAWVAASRPEMRSRAWMAAVGACIALLVDRALQSPLPTSLAPELAAATFVAALGVAASSARRSWIAYATVGALACLAELRWSVSLSEGTGTGLPLAVAIATAFALGAVVLFDRARLGTLRAAWRASAVVVSLWCAPIYALFERRAQDFPASAALLLGALVTGWVAVAVAGDRLRANEEGRREPRAVGYAWFASAAATFVAFAISTYFGKAELLVGGALACVGLALLSRSAWHAGLRAVAGLAALFVLAHFAVQIGLVLSGIHTVPRTGWPIAHWLSYEFGVPALALFAAALALRVDVRDLERLTSTVPWRAPLPALSGWFSLAAILALFVWLNVEVVNLCSSGTTYAFGLERHAARDVWLSVAWSLYALALLVVGVRLDRSPLRWTSLAFFVGTAGKVFLYDMGELRGLYRVASLVGLALALLSVSLLYQRFVFRAKPLAQ